jgi:hypothetical protein
VVECLPNQCKAVSSNPVPSEGGRRGGGGGGNYVVCRKMDGTEDHHIE